MTTGDRKRIIFLWLVSAAIVIGLLVIISACDGKAGSVDGEAEKSTGEVLKFAAEPQTDRIFATRILNTDCIQLNTLPVRAFCWNQGIGRMIEVNVQPTPQETEQPSESDSRDEEE